MPSPGIFQKYRPLNLSSRELRTCETICFKFGFLAGTAMVLPKFSTFYSEINQINCLKVH